MKIFIQLFSLFLFTHSVIAHHSTSTYDFEREVNLQGTVVAFSWANPHIYIDIETLNTSNTIIIRRIEGPAPIALSSVGWNEESLMPGEFITINANPALDQESTNLMGNSVLTQSGDYLPMGGMRLQEALRRR
ncbi:MAG: DUF6152 family protein [Gammaproteobacteria bacterium]|jgi:hypothetical protein|nr:DUF6152 family protein [Gammaproteobacteria bacterium]